MLEFIKRFCKENKVDIADVLNHTRKANSVMLRGALMYALYAGYSIRYRYKSDCLRDIAKVFSRSRENTYIAIKTFEYRAAIYPEYTTAKAAALASLIFEPK